MKNNKAFGTYGSVDRWDGVRAGDAFDRSAQQALDLVLGQMQEGVFATDKSWRFTYLNDQAAGFWGRRREELLGRSMWECLL